MKKILTAVLVTGAFASLSCARKPLLSSARSSEDAYRECHAYGRDKDYEKANECLELLKSRFSGSAAAHEADLEIGDNYFRKGDYLLAAETYLSFIKLHPDHDRIGYAYYKAGLSYMREAPKPIDRDQQYLKDAIRALETAASSTTGDLNDVTLEKLKEARTRIAKRQFYIGRFYYRTGEYLSAIPRLREVVTEYSGLGLDERALFLLGDSYLHLSDKEKGLEILSVLEQHFPKGEYKRKLARKIGIK